ncbi:hypothetical protein, partial [Streptomyces albus]
MTTTSVDEALRAAAAAAGPCARTTPTARAGMLTAVADALEAERAA